ncbi:MAG: magnesium transporter [Rickettsiaceae bacterium]|nr:magnesium transporter [Rickettsiaceae bacterium]
MLDEKVQINDNSVANNNYQLRLDQQLERINAFLHHRNLSKASTLLLDLHYADLADFLDNLPHKEYKNILPIIADNLSPHVLLSLSDANKQPIIKALGVSASAKLINELGIEDSIEIIETLSPHLKQQILDSLDAQKRQQIIEGFKYPENATGRILEKDFVSLKEHWTVGQAIDYIKRSSIKSDFNAAIITDNAFKPIGTVLLSKLLRSHRTTPVIEIMNQHFMVAHLDTDIDEVAFMFKQYALTIVPVVNKQGKLMGSISINNMLYIIEEKTESEILNLSGINNSDIFYNLFLSAKNRFPWLFINLITACIASTVIRYFDNTISQLVVLAIIMPIVASMGGNAGTQAMTVTVRAISNREINVLNSLRFILKEIYTCAINGSLLSVIGGLVIYILFRDIELSVVFGAAIVINFTLAGMLGSTIPIILNRFNIDPATASGVLLTACTDTMGFFIFLWLSQQFLI